MTSPPREASYYTPQPCTHRHSLWLSEFPPWLHRESRELGYFAPAERCYDRDDDNDGDDDVLTLIFFYVSRIRSGRVGSRGFKTSRAASGQRVIKISRVEPGQGTRPDPTRPARFNSTREKP